jgi:hypothetical protein
MLTARVVQGQGFSTTVTISACPVDASMALVGTISDGLTGPPILPFTPVWAGTGPPNLLVVLTPSQTAAIPPGGYVIQVGLANGGGPLVYGSFTVLAAPGNVPLFDVLATPGRFLLSDPQIRSNPDRVSAIPMAIRAASDLIRRVCYRRFTRGTYTEYHLPSQEGEVRLNEFPVNRLIRVSRRLQEAVSIQADPRVFQTAYVDFATEDGAFADPANLTYTGINLVGSSNGVASTAAVPFASLTTLNDLVAAVNAASGWTASADGFGAWPVSEIYCDATSQGALSDGVKLKVFSDDASPQRIDRATGFLYMGYGRFGGFGPRWGPAWAQYDDQEWVDASSTIRVVYDGGFTVVPEAIQNATIELARLIMDRMLIDYTLKSETIGTYSYELNDKLLGISIPESIRGAISPFIGHIA